MKMKLDGIGEVDVDVETMVRNKVEEIIGEKIQEYMEQNDEMLSCLISQIMESVMPDLIKSEKVVEAVEGACVEYVTDNVSEIFDEYSNELQTLSKEIVLESTLVRDALSDAMVTHIDFDYNDTLSEVIDEAVADLIKNKIEFTVKTKDEAK